MCVYRKAENDLSVCLKTKTTVVFQKRNWNFAFAFQHQWLDLELLNLLLPLKFYLTTFERQLIYLECSVTIPLRQSNNLNIILCHQSFLLHCLSLTCWNSWFLFFQKRMPILANIGSCPNFLDETLPIINQTLQLHIYHIYHHTHIKYINMYIIYITYHKMSNSYRTTPLVQCLGSLSSTFGKLSGKVSIP